MFTRTFFAVLVAASFLVACDVDSSTPTQAPTTEVTETPTVVVETPIVTTLEVTLRNALTDGKLQMSVFETGDGMDLSYPETVMNDPFARKLDVLVGDTCVVRLQYEDLDYETEIQIDGDGYPLTVEIDVDSALPCAGDTEIKNYAWTCEGTNIEGDANFYVKKDGNHCSLWREGIYKAAPEGTYWIYHGQGSMSIAICNEPDCWNDCTGTPLP